MAEGCPSTPLAQGSAAARSKGTAGRGPLGPALGVCALACLALAGVPPRMAAPAYAHGVGLGAAARAANPPLSLIHI